MADGKQPETKSEKFHRLAQERLGKLLYETHRTLALFENLSAPFYDWTVDEVDAYMQKFLEEVEQRVCEVSSTFKAKAGRRGTRSKTIGFGDRFKHVAKSISITETIVPTVNAAADGQDKEELIDDDTRGFDLESQRSETDVSDQSENEPVSVETEAQEKQPRRVRRVKTETAERPAVQLDAARDGLEVPGFLRR